MGQLQDLHGRISERASAVDQGGLAALQSDPVQETVDLKMPTGAEQQQPRDLCGSTAEANESADRIAELGRELAELQNNLCQKVTVLERTTGTHQQQLQGLHGRIDKPSSFFDQAQTAELSKMVGDIAQQLLTLQNEVAQQQGVVSSCAELVPALTDVEGSVRQLQRQVVEELNALAHHQQQLEKAAVLAEFERGPGGSDASVAVRDSASARAARVEKSVERLLQDMSQELANLQDHRRKLQQLGDADACALSVQAGINMCVPKRLEERVQWLSNQVTRELHMLSSNQEDLGHVKITLTEIEEQLKDAVNLVVNCQTANLELKRQFETQQNGTIGIPAAPAKGGRA